MNPDRLIKPHGAPELVNLMVPEADRSTLRILAENFPSVILSERSECDLELLATGALTPLTTFMGHADYDSVLSVMRLQDGTLFPIPVTLSVHPMNLPLYGESIALRNSSLELLAIMRLEEIYKWSIEDCRYVFGTLDHEHPMIAEMHTWGELNISGELMVVQLPSHSDFHDLRLTPEQVRERLCALGNPRVVAFQTRNPMHRAHEELTKLAMDRILGTLLLHPVVGPTQPGDVSYRTRVRTYQALVDIHYKPNSTVLALLPLAMRMAGPREALWHAIIRQNYGASHIIIGRHHASPKGDFYAPDEAQILFRICQEQLKVQMLAFDEIVYLPDQKRYVEASEVPSSSKSISLSGTTVRECLEKGKEPPEWLMRPEVSQILLRASIAPKIQGVCVWFTGLSGSGKTTVAEVLRELLRVYKRYVTVLDGDVVRQNLSKGLGFSKEDRDTNIRRIGFVASEIVKHEGIVLCAAISPYQAAREEVRHMVGTEQFVEVYMDTPLEVCEARDTKGLYARARRGEISNFTGISDPYEVPLTPEVALDTVAYAPEESANQVLDYLIGQLWSVKEGEAECCT